jgi:hypothetical protein
MCRKRSWSNMKKYPNICLEETEEDHKHRIYGVPDEIRTRLLPHTCRKLCLNQLCRYARQWTIHQTATTTTAGWPRIVSLCVASVCLNRDSGEHPRNSYTQSSCPETKDTNHQRNCFHFILLPVKKCSHTRVGLKCPVARVLCRYGIRVAHTDIQRREDEAFNYTHPLVLVKSKILARFSDDTYRCRWLVHESSVLSWTKEPLKAAEFYPPLTSPSLHWRTE